MKELRFSTSKGDFILAEAHEKGDKWLNNGKYTYVAMLKGISEKQASSVVDEYYYHSSYTEQDEVVYLDYIENTLSNIKELSAIDSLYSLLHIKGIYLFENPTRPRMDDMIKYQEDEAKTFYNPYIFKV